jgi:primary-amine oxidase
MLSCFQKSQLGIVVLLSTVVIGCEVRANSLQSAAPVEHPLDPLTADEYTKTLEVLREAGHIDDATRFANVELREPTKSRVTSWSEGEDVSRTSFSVIKQGPQTFEAVVDLSDGKVSSWTEIEGVQPSVLLEEFTKPGEALALNAEFTAALATRGFTMDEVFCVPHSLGNYGIPGHEGKRLIKLPCFVLGEDANFWSRPIEGLGAVVDLNSGEVIEIYDGAIIPVPDVVGGYDEASVGATRAALDPVLIHQPNGANFTIRGHVIEWDNWTFHYRMDKRSGLVVSDVSYREHDVERPVMYQGSLSEIFVPYMDPTGLWFSRTFMDSGEYGFGGMATPLVRGYDCPETSLTLGAVLPDDMGNPYTAEDVICVFERNIGDPAWRHLDNVITQTYEGRRSVELVTRMIATVGNYDYYLDWVFSQDGRIIARIGATGMDGLKGVLAQSMDDPTAADETAYGTLVAPGLVATNHDHFFSFRLDLDVAGTNNSLSVDRIVPTEFEGPRSGWIVESEVAATEGDAQLDYNAASPAVWRVINPDADGPFGNKPGYVLRPGNSIAYSLLSKDDMAQKRGGFTNHHLWVTPHEPDEFYAAGLYPNQSDGTGGLPAWASADRPIENTDIVVWYTAGFHHVPRTEDFPVMPTAFHQFELMPFNFFDGNPALDIPTNWRGVTAGGGGN